MERNLLGKKLAEFSRNKGNVKGDASMELQAFLRRGQAPLGNLPGHTGKRRIPSASIHMKAAPGDQFPGPPGEGAGQDCLGDLPCPRKSTTDSDVRRETIRRVNRRGQAGEVSACRGKSQSTRERNRNCAGFCPIRQ